MSENELAPLKVLAKGAGIVLIGLSVSKVISYVSRIFIARYFGPSDYGLFTLGLAILGFFMTFAILGLQTGVIRYTAHYRTKGDEKRVKGVITSSIKIVLVASFVMSFLMLISSEFIAVSIFNEPALKDVLIILALSIPFSSLFTVFVSVFIGFKEIKYNVYLESVFINLAKLFFIIIFGILGLGIIGITWVWTITAILGFLMSVYFIVKIYPTLKKKVVSIEMKKDIFLYSLPLLLSASMGFVILWTDTLMLGYFKDAADVGIYNAAMPTAQILILIPNALAALFLPIITELHARNKMIQLKKFYQTVSRWAFYINFPLFLLFIFFSKEILNLMFGPDYVAGYTVMIFVSIGFLLRKTFPVPEVLHMLKKTKHIFYIAIITVIVNVSLNYWLVPLYGISGAAISSMITYTLVSSILFFLSYYFLKCLPFSKNMIKSIVAGIITIAVVYPVSTLLFTTIPTHILLVIFSIYIMIYFFILLVLRGFDRDDIEILKSIERKSKIRLKFFENIMKKFV